jgi:hypothetical protein
MVDGKLALIDKNTDLLTEEFYVLKTCYEELIKQTPNELPLSHRNSIGCDRGLYSKY